MIEPFKIIPGFNNRFLATSKGEIYDTQNKCVLKPGKTDKRHEHYRVSLPGFGRYQVHPLVALAYHGCPPFENADIHHCNQNKLDNNPQNLVYLTKSAHTALHYMFDTNRAEKIKKAAKKWGQINIKKAQESCKKPVIQLTLDGIFVAKYPSVKDAFEQTGIFHISNVATGKRKSAGGFKWIHETDFSSLSNTL